MLMSTEAATILRDLSVGPTVVSQAVAAPAKASDPPSGLDSLGALFDDAASGPRAS